MPLPKPLQVQLQSYVVYKTGIAFYDAARLIGVAHLFFGTASAEVEDKGAYWEVQGIGVKRDEEQVLWVIERGKQISYQLSQKDADIKKAFRQEIPRGVQFQGLPIKGRGRSSYPAAIAELDSALVRGTRGVDPLANSYVLSQVEREHVPVEKNFNVNWADFLVLTIGFSFAASCFSRDIRSYILPVFKERFVLSGFLEFKRRFYHSAAEIVAKVYAAISILLELMNRRIPVTDFVHSSIRGRNIAFSSGYLGLERLCDLWWKAVQENDSRILDTLRQVRQLLRETSGQNINEQVQSFARYVAEFVTNPNVDALTIIERLKARILASSQSQNIAGAFAANQFLNRSELIKEVGKMVQSDLPEVPWQVSEALARALTFDEKGWMNQFTRLENSPNFSQFIRQVEHIISRGLYREQQDQGEQPNIRNALTRARDLAKQLNEIGETLQGDDRKFRTFKAVFLLDVLSRQRIRASQPQEQTSTPEGVPASSETQTPEEG